MSVNADFAATVPWDGILNPQLASTTEPGLVGTLPGDKTKFLDGTGNFTEPASAGGDVTGPVSSTAGHLALFADGTGKVIEDGGAPPASLPPNGSAGGDLAGSYPNPTVAAIHESGTQLVIGSIPDGSFLKRSGATVIGGTPSGSGNVTGPSSSTDSDIVLFDGTSGEMIKDSGHAIGDFLLKANNLSDVANATTALDNLLPSQTGNSGKALVTNGTAASWQTVAGGTPPEIYLSNYASLALADAAAVTANAVLVINQDTVISATISVTSPVRVAGGRFKIATSQVLTLAAGIEAPLTKIFIPNSGVIGTVQLTTATKSAWPEWWGALGGTAGNDDGPGINSAITACYTGSSVATGNVTLTFANKTYYLQTQIAMQYAIPVLSLPGACIKPSTSSPATNGMVAGGAYTFNWEAIVFLPRFEGFTSGFGLQLYNCNLATINIGMIVSCGDGVQLFSDQNGACLDNNINIQGCFSCGDAAIKVKTDGNVGAGLATIQGNVVYINFVNTCQRWIYFVQTGGGNGAQNDNRFVTDAVDWTGVTGAIVIDNATGVANTTNVFTALGFFAGPTDGVFGAGQFEGCTFTLSGAPPLPNYSSFGIAETSTNDSSFGNRYDWSGPLSQNLSSSNAATSAGSRASYNGGTPVAFNRIKVVMGITSLASLASTNFYIYSPMVLGSARLTFVPRAMSGCVCTNLSDNTSANANEILISVTNVTLSTILSTNLVAEILVGIP